MDMAKNKAIEKTPDGLYEDSDGNKLTKAQMLLTEENSIIGSEKYTNFVVDILKLQSNGNITIERREYPKLQASKILDNIPYNFFVPGLSKAKKLLVLETTFQEQLENKPIRIVNELAPGYNFLCDNALLFAFGNKVYGKIPDDSHLRLPTHTFTVREPLEGTDKELSWVLNFIKCGAAQTALLVASLSAYMEPFLELLQINERLCIVLLGETGSGKTSFGSLATSRFIDFKGCSLTSDKRDFFELLSKCGTSPVLIEELNKTASNSLKDKNNRMFSELVQCFSSSGSKIFGGKKLSFSVTPVITAEYLVKNYSTTNRCVVIDFPEKPDFSKLSWLQKNISRYDLFMDKFLHWLCNSYNRYKDKVRNWQFDSFKVECEDAYAGISRVKRSYKILKITAEIILSFIKEEYSLPDEQLKKIQKSMDRAINESIYNTMNYLRKIDGETGTYYLNELLSLFFHNYKDYVADNYEEYKQSRKKDSAQKRKILFKHDDYFCISGDDLYNYFTEECEPEFKITKQAISNQLLSHGLLKIRKGERSFPVTTGNGSESRNRYYHIYQCEILNHLNEKYYESWGGRITLDTLQDT